MPVLMSTSSTSLNDISRNFAICRSSAAQAAEAISAPAARSIAGVPDGNAVGVRHHHPVAAGPLGLVECFVGKTQEGGEIARLRRALRDAHADRERDRRSLPLQRRRLDVDAQPLGERECAGEIGDRQDDREFLAAQPTHGVDRAHHFVAHARDRLDHRIAGAVAKRVVDPLEVIDIDQHDRERFAGAAAALHFLGARFHQPPAIGHAGQCVGHCLAAQLFFHLLALRDVRVQGDDMGDRAFVAIHRRDRHVLPQQRAVLAAPAELAAPLLSAHDGLPQVGAVFVGGARAQQLRHFAQHLARLIARHFGEGGIRVLDARIAIGDEDGGRAAIDGGLELAQRIVGLAQLRICANQGQMVLHPRPDDAGREWFGDVIDRAQREALFLVALAIGAGNENHRNVARFRLRFEPATSLVAVELRHHHIEQDQIRPMLQRLLQRPHPVAREHDIAEVLKQILQQQHILDRIDDQYDWHIPPTSHSAMQASPRGSYWRPAARQNGSRGGFGAFFGPSTQAS